MSKRLSIYVGPPVDDALNVLGEAYRDNVSGRLNTVCERYLAMVSDELARLDLTEAEWCAIMEANNDVDMGVTDRSTGAVLLWATVHDCRGLGERWGVDQLALVKKLQQLPRSTLLAIREVADRFWSNWPDPSYDLRRAGVRLPSAASQ